PRRVGTLRDAAGVEAHAGLVQIAAHSGSKLVEVLLTADHIVETSEEKNRLASWGDAVDMESYAIMRDLSGEGIPAVTIRAVSDASDEDLPIDFSACLTTEGNVKPLPLLMRLLRRPAKTVDLVGFGVRSKRAARNLAEFLDSFVAALNPEAIRKDIGVAAHPWPRACRHRRRSRRGGHAMEARRPRHELSSHPLRQVLLLRPSPVLPMQAIQNHWPDRRFHAQRRRLRRIRQGHALGRRTRHR